MADKLTPQQAQAVSNRGGTLLVSAAAGSGKTKVLVDRLLSYLMDPKDPANLDEFVIITYTKAAASELRSKIAAKLTECIANDPGNRHLQKQMQRLFLTKISTVHGFCGDLLREYAYRLDLAADFRVADENECRELREMVLSDLLDRAYDQETRNQDFLTFVDTLGFGRDDRFIPQIVEKVYDSARCHLDPAKWLKDCLGSFESAGISDASQTIWGRYLIDALHEELDCQIAVMKQCANLAEDEPKVASNLWDTVHQLEHLRSLNTWDEIYRSGGITFTTLRFPAKTFDPEQKARIKAARDACKAEVAKKLEAFSEDSSMIFEDMLQSAASARSLVSMVEAFDQAYSAAKRARRILDFGDLEHKTLDLLLGKSRTNPTAASMEIGRRYREILVDEYQDSNSVQDAIFTALTRERNNCFLVGDVKQSIYQFRLADPGIFLKKYHSFVAADCAEPGQGRKVLLSHNFRSGPEIVDCVNDVFRACMRPKVGGLHYGEAEQLREGVPRAPLPGQAVELYVLETQDETYAEEAEFVADKISAMLSAGTLVRGEEGLRPVEPEDIVILLRSPSSTGGYFQRALEAKGIKCSAGSDKNLLQTEEVETLYSFLQTIMNPRQDIYLIGTLASPLFGFTADDLAAFRGENKRGSVYDALLQSKNPKAKYFLETLAILRREARMSTLTGLLERCYSLTRLDSIYAAMPGGDVKAGNLQAFYQLAADFEQGSLRDLSQFLNYLDIMSADGRIQVKASTSGCVTIMSIHKSKGLEFPVVFLSNLAYKFSNKSFEDKIYCDQELGLGMPVADTSRRIFYPSIAKRAIAVKMKEDRTSEEMRLLYVAMTRARDRLIMTYASKHLHSSSTLSELEKIALRQDFDQGELLCRTAGCLGRWVLLAASQHTEAGELHALGGHPMETRLGAFPWIIRSVETEAASECAVEVNMERESVPVHVISKLQESLLFRYGHLEATSAPSKQTATGRKGRVKDEEAAQNAQQPKALIRSWKKPAFYKSQREGKVYGNAIHGAMQYLRYEECSSLNGVETEIARLVNEEFLSREQAEMVDCQAIAAFFQTDIGRKLSSGTSYLREFKFSILDNGSHYGSGLENEKVLLQGVVDCALLEQDGITILDFKTDRVTLDTVSDAAECYRTQIETYAEALSRIYEMPIKKKYLYFFHLNQFAEIK